MGKKSKDLATSPPAPVLDTDKDSEGLTLRQLGLVNAFIATGSKEQAKLDAGYSPASNTGTIFNTPYVQAAIARRLDKISAYTEVESIRALQETARLAFVNMDDFFDDDGQGNPKSKKWGELSRDLKAAIKEMSVVERVIGKNDDGSPIISRTFNFKLVDKTGPLALLERQMENRGIFEHERSNRDRLSADNNPGVRPLSELLAGLAVAVRAAESHAAPGANGPILSPPVSLTKA